MMALHQDEIVRLRLLNQHICTPQAAAPAEMVRWLGAVQAQDFTGAKWGVGLRLLGARDETLEQAFSAGLILRTHLMRPTWHFVTPQDIRWLLALTAPRVRMVMGTTDRQQGIDDELVRRCNRSFEKALQGSAQLTRDELRHKLVQDGIDPGSGQRMGNLMMRAELDGVVCSGPRQGKQFTYMLLEERVPAVKALDRGEALAELAGRFFTSRGPATLKDFSWWSGLTLGEARNGLEAVKDQLSEQRWEGQSYWLRADSAPAVVPGLTTHLISIFDEYLSGYQDRSAMVDPGYVETLRGLGNGLLNVVVVDGRIVGAWRRTERKSQMTIELNLFRKLEEAEQAAVAAAGRRYGAFFEKEVSVQA